MAKAKSVSHKDFVAFQKRMRSKYGESIRDFGEEQLRSRRAYATGIITVDLASGIGGFPQGNLIEIWGPPSAGKSLLALQAMGYAQKVYGLPSVYFDLEYGTPAEWMKIYGIDLDRSAVVGQVSCEQAFDMMIEYIESNLYAYLVIDSVAGLVPKKELEGTVEETKGLALQARAISKGLRKFIPVLNRSKTCAIFINQTRLKPNIMFGSPEDTVGGMALKFYTAQKYHVRKASGKQDVKHGEALIGHTVNVRVTKNKVAPPQTRASFPILYETGVDMGTLMMEAARTCGLARKLSKKKKAQDEEEGEPSPSSSGGSIFELKTKKGPVRYNLDEFRVKVADSSYFARLYKAIWQRAIAQKKEE